MKIRKNIKSVYYQKKVKEIMLIYHYQGMQERDPMFLHCVIKHSCHYCLQAFSTEEILKRHVKDCFKVNGKQKIKMPMKGE